jgi:ClpP class serine protease
MHGDYVFADKASFLGNVGFRMTPWMLKNFAESNQVSVKYVHHGENKVRFNRFQELKQKDVEWVLNILN